MDGLILILDRIFCRFLLIFGKDVRGLTVQAYRCTWWSHSNGYGSAEFHFPAVACPGDLDRMAFRKAFLDRSLVCPPSFTSGYTWWPKFAVSSTCQARWSMASFQLLSEAPPLLAWFKTDCFRITRDSAIREMEKWRCFVIFCLVGRCL